MPNAAHREEELAANSGRPSFASDQTFIEPADRTPRGSIERFDTT